MKYRKTAMLMAYYLGLFGGHLFYLGDKGRAWRRVLIWWTTLPMWWGMFDAYRFWRMTDAEFDAKYNVA